MVPRVLLISANGAGSFVVFWVMAVFLESRVVGFRLGDQGRGIGLSSDNPNRGEADERGKRAADQDVGERIVGEAGHLGFLQNAAQDPLELSA